MQQFEMRMNMTLKQNYSETEYIRINHDKPETPYISIEHDGQQGYTEKEINTNNYSTDEYRNEQQELEQYNKKVIGATGNKYFCVFRIGKKIKKFGQIQAFEKHMERDMIVPNADPERTKFNRVLIGNENITETVQKYIYGIKLRSNANIGVDLVLTAHHKFYNELQQNEKEIWIQHNIKFLKDNFGDRCVYACVHFDETALHVHALIIPRFWNEEKKRFELRSNVYFDGTNKMRDWQDKYADHMSLKFNNLMRGIRGSPQKLDIQISRLIIHF